MKIFTINGLPTTGKTLFGELVQNSLEKIGVPFVHTSSIAPIKMILLPENQWDNGSLPGDRGLLELKARVTDVDWDGVTKDGHWRGVMFQLKELLGKERPDLVHNYCLEQCDKAGGGVSFVDIREPENIKGFKEFVSQRRSVAEVRTVLVSGSDRMVFRNPADSEGILKYDYDIVIKNPGRSRGREAFRRVAESFVTKYCLDGNSLETFPS